MKHTFGFENLDAIDILKLSNVFKQMNQRCNNPHHRDFGNYGKRGITVCNEWSSDNPFGLENFLMWADQHDYQSGLSIDRVDNDGPYDPSNCRFADSRVQANNRSNNHLLTCSGETHTVAQWAMIIGLPAGTVYSRIYRGWPVDRVLKPTVNERSRKKEKNK